MKNQFVTYVIALKLKELGFDEPCFAYYKNEKLTPSVNLNNKACARWVVLNQSSDLSGNDCIAPLWQQAEDYLLELTNYHQVPVIHKRNNGEYTVQAKTYKTRIEAKTAKIEHLIELAKSMLR